MAGELTGKARDDHAGGTARPPRPGGADPSAFNVFAPLRRPQGADETPALAGDSAYQGFAGSAPHPGGPAPFPGRTSATAPPGTPMIPVASPGTPDVSGPPWELSRQTGPLPALATGPDQVRRGSDQGDHELPRRVRQASLAPQLRADPPRRLPSTTTAAPLTGGPTPAEIRQTMSALQRGWNDGRSQQAAGASPSPRPGTDAEPGTGGESDAT